MRGRRAEVGRRLRELCHQDGWLLFREKACREQSILCYNYLVLFFYRVNVRISISISLSCTLLTLRRMLHVVGVYLYLLCRQNRKRLHLKQDISCFQGHFFFLSILSASLVLSEHCSLWQKSQSKERALLTAYIDFFTVNLIPNHLLFCVPSKCLNTATSYVW